MSRLKKKYPNGKGRGGVPGQCVDSANPDGQKRDCHRIAVAFHGGEMAYERWVLDGRRGYGR